MSDPSKDSGFEAMPEPPPPPDGFEEHAPPEDTRPKKTLAMRAAGWSGGGYLAGQVLRFGSNLILTRILFKEDFGLMSLVVSFLTGVQLFSDLGLGQNIIQNVRGDDPKFLNTAWTMGVIRGGGLWVFMCVASIPFSRLYEQPSLALLVPVAGLTALIQGFMSTKFFTQNRALQMGRLALIEIGSQLITSVVMVAWALVDRSVWALVAGSLTAAVARTVASHVFLPGVKNRLAWDSTAAVSLYQFGKWIFFSTVITFLVTQSDRLIFGTKIPMDLLGTYHQAVMIVQMVAAGLGHVIMSVIFPVYSRIAGERPLAPTYLRVRWPIMLVSGWALAGLIAGGATAIRLLYDARWESAGWMVQLLSMGAWFHVVEATNGVAFLARGKSLLIAVANAGKLMAMIVFIPLGFHYGDFFGAVLGYAASDVIKWMVSVVTAIRGGLHGWKQDLFLTAFTAVTGYLGWQLALSIAAMDFPMFELPFGRRRQVSYGIFVEALAVAVAVTALWTPLFVLHVRRMRKEGRSLLPTD